MNWAIIRGEKFTGITLHHLTEQFDEGRIISHGKLKIKYNDTVMDVYQKMTLKGKELLRNIFEMVGTNDFRGFKQDIKQATYFPPRTPKDGKINWTDTAENIRNLVRALTYPYPGAYFYHKGLKVVIEDAEVLEYIVLDVPIGRLFFYNKAYMVKTGSGFLVIKKLRNRELEDICVL